MLQDSWRDTIRSFLLSYSGRCTFSSVGASRSGHLRNTETSWHLYLTYSTLFCFFAVGKSYGVMSHSLALWMRSISRFWSFLRLQDGVLTMDGCASSLLQVPAWRRSFNLFASSFWICEEMTVFQRGLLVLIRCHERCKIELAVEVCWTQLGHAEGTRRGQENQLLVMILPHAVLWWNTKSIKIKQFGAQKLQDFLESL